MHTFPGVGSHWFYLASEGGGSRTINGVTYNGSAVTECATVATA
ncbi:hypothetical protein [Streptomyces sp. BE303]|nr:hypothetical protein [Streptomyces sp. BE303]MED7949677.1 hypothetical protein [Streptomyces sp. BE303]